MNTITWLHTHTKIVSQFIVYLCTRPQTSTDVIEQKENHWKGVAVSLEMWESAAPWHEHEMYL